MKMILLTDTNGNVLSKIEFKNRAEKEFGVKLMSQVATTHGGIPTRIVVIDSNKTKRDLITPRGFIKVKHIEENSGVRNRKSLELIASITESIIERRERDIAFSMLGECYG